MKAIIKAKMQETEIDYNLMGLYSHEEYVGRIMVLKELLKELDNAVDVKKPDCNISRKFQEAEIEEMFEDLEDDQY